MAKSSRRFTNKPITKEETEKIAKAAMRGTVEKTEDVGKKATKGRNQKVLYVSPEHHQEAKKNAFLKGFSQLREYVEYLIDKDKDL